MSLHLFEGVTYMFVMMMIDQMKTLLFAFEVLIKSYFVFFQGFQVSICNYTDGESVKTGKSSLCQVSGKKSFRFCKLVWI